jgi:hypothetical protein
MMEGSMNVVSEGGYQHLSLTRPQTALVLRALRNSRAIMSEDEEKTLAALRDQLADRLDRGAL